MVSNYGIYDFIGNIGVVCVITAFMLIQAGRLKSEDFLYPFINLIGGVCVLISLFSEFNLSTLLINSFWVVISLWGLLTNYLKFRKSNHSPCKN
jgi:hypothetical protein